MQRVRTPEQNLARWLHNARRERGYSQKKVAELLAKQGISSRQARVSKIERGGVMTAVELLALQQVLGFKIHSLSDLMSDPFSGWLH